MKAHVKNSLTGTDRRIKGGCCGLKVGAQIGSAGAGYSSASAATGAAVLGKLGFSGYNVAMMAKAGAVGSSISCLPLCAAAWCLGGAFCDRTYIDTAPCCDATGFTASAVGTTANGAKVLGDITVPQAAAAALGGTIVSFGCLASQLACKKLNKTQATNNNNPQVQATNNNNRPVQAMEMQDRGTTRTVREEVQQGFNIINTIIADASIEEID